MSARSRFGLAALALTLGLARAGLAADPPAVGEPAPMPRLAGPRLSATPVSNKQLAERITAELRQSGRLRNYTVDVAARGVAVEVTGTVADQAQRDEALRIIQGVPGVERVLDRLRVVSATPGLTPVDAPQDGPPSATPPGRLPEPLPSGTTQPPAPSPAGSGTAPAEPVPLFRAPIPSTYGLNPPKMPPYAWPTYAPYNNYSRVAYPTAYPYNAWPFIGPLYPFPKVPLGWRSVRLEWDDGYWWYGRVAHKYDWWRLRYW